MGRVRKLSGLLVVTMTVAICLANAGAAEAKTAEKPAADRVLDAVQRGLNYAGLQTADPAGRCRGRFELVAQTRGECTHGPDPAPPGIEVKQRDRFAQSTGSGPTTAEAAANVPCIGDGSSGMRVEAIYARPSTTPDRYASLRSSISAWAATADQVYNASAAETGGTRHVRFLTDSACNLVIRNVQLSPSGADNISNTINELRQQGFSRSDRKYLVWVDANVYCGIAQVYNDDSPGQTNLSNGNPNVAGEVARVDNGCWGVAGQSIEAHELMHTLGGVNTSAPHATRYSHCTDESDRMCYDDGSGSPLRQVCPSSHENLFDCNHDDYYSTAPPAGSYLATHWNVANSAFLTNAAPQAPSTPQPPSAPPVTAPAATTFNPYGGFAGGVRLARADLDGDGKPEIITGAGPGGGPHVRTFKADGTPIKGFFAYAPGFTGGVNVSCGDFNGDGKADIVTGAGAGGGPHVRTFKADGTPLAGWFAYSPSFTGGVDVAAGQIDGSGTADVVTGAGAGGGPHIRTFRSDGSPLAAWFAYSPGFIGGVRVTCGDVNADGRCEIATGPGPGGGPHVRVFLGSGSEYASFMSLLPTMTNGLDVAAGSDGVVSGTVTGADLVRLPTLR